MRPIIPCFIKLGNNLVTPSYDVIDFFNLVIFMCSSLTYSVATLYIMPPFVPNEYMLKKFEDKVTKQLPILGHENSDKNNVEPWEIYGWCLRDVIAHYGQMKVSDIPLRNKLEYEDFIHDKKSYVEFDRKIYNSHTQEDFSEI